jgi:Flp pilus assembly CpaE family ATPase
MRKGRFVKEISKKNKRELSSTANVDFSPTPNAFAKKDDHDDMIDDMGLIDNDWMVVTTTKSLDNKAKRLSVPLQEARSKEENVRATINDLVKEVFINLQAIQSLLVKIFELRSAAGISKENFYIRTNKMLAKMTDVIATIQKKINSLYYNN